MLNIRMKRSKLIIFILLVLTLVTLNKIFMNVRNYEVSEMPEMVDHNHISSQRLFDNSCLLIL